MDSRKCQTATVTPAEPGDYPFYLNLIERLWKFVKKKVLYSKYYPDFAEFRHAITDCLKQAHTTYKKELDSLLTLNFQTFKKCELVPI